MVIRWSHESKPNSFYSVKNIDKRKYFILEFKKAVAVFAWTQTSAPITQLLRQWFFSSSLILWWYMDGAESQYSRDEWKRRSRRDKWECRASVVPPKLSSFPQLTCPHYPFYYSHCHISFLLRNTSFMPYMVYLAVSTSCMLKVRLGGEITPPGSQIFQNVGTWKWDFIKYLYNKFFKIPKLLKLVSSNTVFGEKFRIDILTDHQTLKP